MDDFRNHGADALWRLLTEVLDDPSRRKAFRKNPQATADEAGIDISALPARVVSMLADLSGSELRLLKELNDELIDGGLQVDVGDGGGGEALMAGGTPLRTLGVL